MAEKLLSVGLDVGTTTTQLVVSELTVENRASAFAVPRLEIGQRRVLYQSPVFFTPLLRGELVDGEGIREIVAGQYRAAGITPESVDTGAVIITGETSRKENARQVLSALAEYAGDFVVATAGPELESVLAAKGADATGWSQSTGKPVLHMDIGGGTSNLALCRDGEVTEAGCLNVGGRLLKFDGSGTVTYVSPVLQGQIPWKVGDRITREQAFSVARLLASVLEMAAGLREKTALFSRFTTQGTHAIAPAEGMLLSFSGGVADCMAAELPWLEYGDLGPLLGLAIRQSALCRENYRLGSQTIRATVIGAGCHSAQLSGSTVFLQNASLPMKNLPVAVLDAGDQTLPTPQLADKLRSRLEVLEEWGVLALPGFPEPDYACVTALADAIAAAVGSKPCYVALEADMAKALGHALSLRLPKDAVCICLDGIFLSGESYLDIGQPVGPALPVIVKTLIFESTTQKGGYHDTENHIIRQDL